LPRAFRAAFTLVVFITAFWTTSAIVRAFVPEQMKFAWLLEIEDDMEVIFVGSSHVLRQMDPAVLHHELSKAGLDYDAFNLGYPGAHFAETTYWADRILDRKVPNLKVLVLEAATLEGGMNPENDLSRRQIEWHDERRMASVLRVSADFDSFGRHFAHYFHRLGNLDRGPAAFEALFFGASRDFEGKAGLGVNQTGFRPFVGNGQSKSEKRRHKEFLADADPFEGKRRSVVDAPWDIPAHLALESEVARLEAKAEANGVQIIWLIHPGMTPAEGWKDLARREVASRVVDFSDSTLSSRWYQQNLRFDFDHLNAVGASEMTQELAGAVLQLPTL
jgi:hypothetical protein